MVRAYQRKPRCTCSANSLYSSSVLITHRHYHSLQRQLSSAYSWTVEVWHLPGLAMTLVPLTVGNPLSKQKLINIYFRNARAIIFYRERHLRRNFNDPLCEACWFFRQTTPRRSERMLLSVIAECVETCTSITVFIFPS